jgi:hypothetical protein
LHLPKKNIEQFYRNLQEKFPEIKNLSTWINYPWYEGGSENSMIMSELAQEMIRWARENRWDDIAEWMIFTESAFLEYDKTTSSYIYTDFLVEIIEIKDRNLRESIKALMKSETKIQYKQLLDFYREA